MSPSQFRSRCLTEASKRFTVNLTVDNVWTPKSIITLNSLGALSQVVAAVVRSGSGGGRGRPLTSRGSHLLDRSGSGLHFGLLGVAVVCIVVCFEVAVVTTSSW